MPNWCEGNIRFRGKKENIKKFLKNEVEHVTYNGENKNLIIDENEYEMTISLPTGETKDDFHFRNTFRNFIFSDTIDIYWPDEEEDEDIIVIIDNFNSAWGLREDGWADHAKKYDIDIRMFGFEQGMQFSEVMTITRKGEVIHDSKHYDDWNWECPFPNMGG